jgi:hypothetical protein
MMAFALQEVQLMVLALHDQLDDDNSNAMLMDGGESAATC